MAKPRRVRRTHPGDADRARDAAGLAELERALRIFTLGELSTPEILSLAVEQTQALVHASGASIEMREGDELVHVAGSGASAQVINVRLPLKMSLSGRSVLHGESLVSSDARLDPRVNQDLAERLNIRSLVVTPLEYSGQVVGALKVIATEPGAFGEWEVASLQVVATVLGSAVGHAQALAERAHAERQERRAAEGLASILRAATEVAIIGVNLHGRITFFSEGARRMLGYEEHEILGSFATIFHDPDELANRTTRQGLSEADVFVGPALRGAPSTSEWTYVRKDGSRLLVSLTVTGMHEPTGELTGFVGVAIDITERKAVERLKDQLLSMVSHELRTPLTAIRASLGLLAAGVVDLTSEQAQRMLKLCSSNAERLTKLVNDILDVERMRAGALQLSRRPVDVDDVLTAAGEAVESLARSAGVRIEVLRAQGSAFLDTDRIEQVLIQLLSNAIKFSPSGSVVQVRPSFEDRHVRIEIEDQGRGIPADHLTRIFEPFHQVDAGDARATGGSGLGLPICRYIVERHGGRIWAQSVLGSGTTVHVELPLDPSTPGPASA